MAPQEPRQHVFDRAGTYRIRVQGMLDESWANRLGGMAIESEANVGLRPVTTLTGTIVDQAALAGILDSLFNLGLTLISVKLIEEEGR